MLLLRVYEQWRGISFLGDHFSAVARGRSCTKGHIAYVPLDPVAYYVHILDLNTRLRVG